MFTRAWPSTITNLISKTLIQHVGNLRCAYLVEQHEIEYEDANKIDKTQIANKIVNIVKANNGRFLKKDKQVRTEYRIHYSAV